MPEHASQPQSIQWKHDGPASVVVFLVALPLCLGVALASGAPLFAGIIAGVVGGLVVGSLSGSALMVSGPAAGLTAIVLAAITQLGDYRAFLVAVVIGGVIQLILAALAAILLHTGFKLAHPSILRAMIRRGRSQWIPYVITVAAILFTDLLVGISIGMSVGVFIILRDTLLNPPFTEVSPRGAVLRRWQLHDHVNFLNKAALLSELDALEPGSRIEVDGRTTRRIDADALEVLHQFSDTATLRNIDYRLVAIPSRQSGAGAH